MPVVREPSTVELSRSMMEHLLVKPGRAEDMFIFTVVGRHRTDAVFHALHVIKTLFKGAFNFAVLQETEVQVFVRCWPEDTVRLDGLLPRYFQFDHELIKITKVGRLELMSYEDDTLYRADEPELFPAAYGRLSGEDARKFGYPAGYTDIVEPMEPHKNPRLSETTMILLGVKEGETEGVLKVNIKHSLGLPQYFEHVYQSIPWKTGFKDAVDQNGFLFLKFDNPLHYNFLAESHYYTDRFMIKFYRVESLSKIESQLDKAKQSKVYSRVNREDDWEEYVDA